MVAKKSSDEKGSRVKVGKLKLNKESVKDLTVKQQQKIKGGGNHVGSARCIVTEK